MNFAGAFRHSRSRRSANKPLRARVVAVWLDFKAWSKGVAERLLVEEPGDDPTAHFGPRDWADLPPHHPNSPE
ncbi:hypothetical protein H4W29_003996 [Rhizobium viscosum]|uniref:Uncharacterized protein n=1 Tax=Rhizobium viscosum TaxID=1673 RepID=A0ABR9IUM8_RHIVS|nr:hypothetical protein [Rhizobium viscosum]